MTIRKPLPALALAAVVAAGAFTASTVPASAEDGRIGAFVGGALLGGIIANSMNPPGYGYAPPPPPTYYYRPRVVVREYAPPPDVVYVYRRDRWHHRHHWGDDGWDN